MKSTTHNHVDQAALLRSVMDVDGALERLGNDADLLQEIVKIYLEDAPAIVEKIREATASGDAAALQRAAHSLKGLAATLSAHEVIGCAVRLEHMGATGALADSASAVVEADRRVAELSAAARKYLQNP